MYQSARFRTRVRLSAHAEVSTFSLCELSEAVREASLQGETQKPLVLYFDASPLASLFPRDDRVWAERITLYRSEIG